MLKFASHRGDGDAIRRAQPVTAEYARPATDADKFRAAGLHQPARVAGFTNEDLGLATLAERIRADGINNPRSVVAGYARSATDADKFRAAGLHQPARSAGFANEDLGQATLAERIRADGIS
jgi:SLT domain-containing protein